MIVLINDFDAHNVRDSLEIRNVKALNRLLFLINMTFEKKEIRVFE
jgi:hypothetical protein